MPSKRRLGGLAILVALLVHAAVHAGGGPQNVAVVVNPDDPESLGIANYYIELRQIPASNVFYIPWRKDLAVTTGVQFRDRLLKPLLAQLKARGIADQIDYLTFSSGYPYVVNCTTLFAGQEFPPHARPMISLTSAGYFYQHILDGDAGMFGMAANDYFAPTANGVTASHSYSVFRASAPPGRKKHLLCTALGVTLGHGNTPGEITACLRRAKQADGLKHRGTIYYMHSNNVRSNVRDAGYQAAARELEALGVKAAVLPGVVPRGKPDVAGLTTGAPHVELKAADCTLLPGALVDNLTSAGGQMQLREESKPQTRISEYIRLGAAGASGTVVEPFAIAQKFPSPALHVHYARGYSLAEAYYQSVAAPFHLLIIGDPLCQPWAVAPEVRVVGAHEGAVLMGRVTLTPAASFPDGREVSRFELFVDGKRRESIQPHEEFAIDTSELADGWHELRVVAIGAAPIEVQGAWIAAVQIRNGRDQLELQHDEPIRAAIGSTVALDVASPHKADVQIMHNGREIAVAAGGSGRVEFEAKLLGKGRTMVHAEQADAVPLRSNPVTIEVH